jgi:hypothetical protein
MMRAEAAGRARGVAKATTDAGVRRWAIATMFVVGGYMVFQRPFAYLGVPGVPLFVGEMMLAAFFVFRPKVSGHRLMMALTEPSPLGALAWSMLLLVAYGLVLAIRGDAAGYPRRLLVQELVFNIYPLYLLLGIWLAEHDPRLLERFMLGLAWVNGIYGVLYMAVLNQTLLTLPGTNVLLFRSPLGQSALLLALMAFRPKGYKMAVPFILNLVILLGIQSRASYAGFAIGLAVWAILSKRIGQTIAVIAVVASLLGAAWILDLRIEFARGASEYSARNIAAAVIAPFDEQTAARYSEDARNFSGTTEWRKTWWAGIWNTVHSTPTLTAFGPGYGFELTSTADLRSSEDDLRTPHNWFMYALGYGGWLGVLSFVFLLLALGHLLWRTFRLTGQAFGLAFLASSVTIATFSNYFETPYAAIPVWVITGMAAAPALRRGRPSPPELQPGPASPPARALIGR